MTITKDATSNQYFPANALEWYELLRGQSPAWSPPIDTYQCQEASGSLIAYSRNDQGSSGQDDMAVVGTTSFANAVSGYARKAVHVSAFSACAFGSAANGFINPSSWPFAALMCIKLAATESGTQNQIFCAGCGNGSGTYVANQGVEVYCDSTGKITFSIKGNVATSSSSYSGTTDPIWLFFTFSRGLGGQASFLRIYNKAGTLQETLTPTDVAGLTSVSDTCFGDAFPTLQSADMTMLYAAIWFNVSGISQTMASNLVTALNSGPLATAPFPTLVAVGTATSSTAGITPAWPSGHQSGDLGVLIVETANQPVATPSGWTLFPSCSQGTGTAGASGATAIQVFYKYATSSSESAPSVADSGDHTLGQILVFRNVAAGTPYDVTAGAANASPGSPETLPSITTTKINDLILYVMSNNASATSEVPSYWRDNNGGTAKMSGFGGPAVFKGVTTGFGGGFAVALGVSVTAQAISTTDIAFSATANGKVSIALLASSPALDDGGGSFDPPSAIGDTTLPAALIGSSAAQDFAMSPSGLDDGGGVPVDPPILWSPPLPIGFAAPSGDDYVVVLDDGGPSPGMYAGALIAQQLPGFEPSQGGEDFVIVLDDGSAAEYPDIEPPAMTWLENAHVPEADVPAGYLGGHPPIGSPLVGPSKKKFATVKGRNK